MGTTRATLRRAIGRLCGDLIVSTATATGTTTTLIDTTNLVAGDDSLIGRQAYFVAGTAGNVGLTRRVSDNVATTGTITFAAVTTATATGDVVELFANRAVSPSPSQIHDKINDLIREVSEKNLTIVDATDAAFDQESPYIDVPSGWIGVCGAQYLNDADEWVTIDPADWELHPNLGARGQVEIKHYPRWAADTRSVHLKGVTPAAVLASDSDSTIVSSAWLRKQAAGELLIENARSFSDVAGSERRGNLWLQEARVLKQEAVTRPPANFRRVNRA